MPLDPYDGMWFYPLADHVCELLSRLAALADAEDNDNSAADQINVDVLSESLILALQRL